MILLLTLISGVAYAMKSDKKTWSAFAADPAQAKKNFHQALQEDNERTVREYLYYRHIVCPILEENIDLAQKSKELTSHETMKKILDESIELNRKMKKF